MVSWMLSDVTLQPVNGELHKISAIENERAGLTEQTPSSAARGEIIERDELKTIGRQLVDYRFCGVKLFEVDPFRPGDTRHQAFVAPDALVRELSLVFGIVQQSDRVQRSTEHQNPSSGYDDFLQWRPLPV